MAFLRLEMRLERSKSLDYLIPIGSILLALIIGGLILLGTGANPLAAYREMFGESLGTGYGISETLVKATPLILCGLGVMIAFKMLFWNIGAEGQLHMGAFAATFIALTGWEGSAWTMIPTMMLGGMIAGAVWALIPALLKVKLNVNEIITTLLLNYVAILWVDYLSVRPVERPGHAELPPDQTISGGRPASAVRRHPGPPGDPLRHRGRRYPLLPPRAKPMGV